MDEQMKGAGKECMDDISAVLARYQGRLYHFDAKDILANLAMIFQGDEKKAALLLHEAGMDVAFYHGLSNGLGGD